MYIILTVSIVSPFHCYRIFHIAFKIQYNCNFDFCNIYTYKCLSTVNKRLDEWVTGDRLDMKKLQFPKKEAKTPSKNGLPGSRPNSPEREVVGPPNSHDFFTYYINPSLHKLIKGYFVAVHLIYINDFILMCWFMLLRGQKMFFFFPFFLFKEDQQFKFIFAFWAEICKPEHSNWYWDHLLFQLYIAFELVSALRNTAQKSDVLILDRSGNMFVYLRVNMMSVNPPSFSSFLFNSEEECRSQPTTCYNSCQRQNNTGTTWTHQF